MDVKYVKSVTRRREKQVQISHFYRLTYKILNINHSQKVHREVVVQSITNPNERWWACPSPFRNAEEYT